MINYLIGFAVSFAAGYIIAKQFKKIKAGRCSVHDDCDACGIKGNCPTQNNKNKI